MSSYSAHTVYSVDRESKVDKRCEHRGVKIEGTRHGLSLVAGAIDGVYGPTGARRWWSHDAGEGVGEA
jgi:hypothetical protein